jgi:hypothetical protein
VDTGEYGAASIDGDDVNSSIAGRSLTLTVASPDTLDADEELYRDECNVTIEDATTADDIMCGKATGNLTLTSFDCVGIGGSPSALVMEVRECTNAGATCADMGAQVTVAAVETNYSDTSFTDSAIDDGDWWQIAVISVTTAPTYVHCQAEFTRND